MLYMRPYRSMPTSFHHKLTSSWAAYDLYYVYNYSFWLDLRILARTLLVVITGRGAF